MIGALSIFERIPDWAKSASVTRKLAYVLVFAALVSGVATIATMADGTSSITEIKTILNLLYIDGILLLLLGLLVAKRLVTIWQEKRRGQAGAGLHVRLVMLFGLVAVTPAILVAVFSALFINYGVQAWFSDRIQAAVNQSAVVAQAYLQEHRKNIYADAFAIASDLGLNAPLLGGNPVRFNQTLSQHAAARSLSEVLVINRSGQVMARSELSLTVFAKHITKEVFDEASRGEITVLSGEQEDRIRAIVRLQSFVDAFLVVERFVDPKVVKHVKLIERAYTRYKAIQKEMGGIKISFVMIFVVVAVLLLLVAVWVGLTVSTQLATPISSLISAAEKVSDGDLSVRVDTTNSPDEISALSRAFNTMTSQLKNTQEGLMDANRQLDERRRFTETVLAGVSAGVIGLDSEGNIHLPNRSASELLGKNLEEHLGHNLAVAVPEMADLLAQILERPVKPRQVEIRISRDGQFHTLMVTIAAERLNNEIIGYVVTFDDVTELFSAQRKAAWADVAQRIAHEIKNPLTPIQLSAERLKRKYLGEIKSDPETFASCTDTIVRQVEDLHRMVDEFSSFARMPQLSLGDENLSEICRGAISLERNRHPEIMYEDGLPKEDMRLYCDHRQVSRAVTNLMKNAAEAISGKNKERESPDEKGVIRVSLEINRERGKREDSSQGTICVIIEDNGRGLPVKDREQLTEPYVTTRTKGTGLGLAIVKKIMEDHNGLLVLEDRQKGGARVKMIFPPMERLAENGKKVSNEDDAMKVATGLLTGGI